MFDCSARHSGVSLINVIHAGPKMQSELFGNFIRLRRNHVGIVCDIKEMYLSTNRNRGEGPTLLQISLAQLWNGPWTRWILIHQSSIRERLGTDGIAVFCSGKFSPTARSLPTRGRDSYQICFMDNAIVSIEDGATVQKLYKELQELWGIAGMQAQIGCQTLHKL